MQKSPPIRKTSTVILHPLPSAYFQTYARVCYASSRTKLSTQFWN